MTEKTTDLSSQLTSQTERLNERETQLDDLRQERDQVLEELEKKVVPSIETIDNESQTDDRQHKRLVQSNNKLKGTLKVYKDKIDRVATELSDLFANVDEDADERLDHLISTVESQAAQINVLQTDRNQLEEELQNEIKQLQQNISEKDDAHRSLDERLKGIELELQRTKEDQASKATEDEEKLHTLTQERDALLDQQ